MPVVRNPEKVGGNGARRGAKRGEGRPAPLSRPDETPLPEPRFVENDKFLQRGLDSGGALCYLSDPLRRERGPLIETGPGGRDPGAEPAPLFENGTAFSGIARRARRPPGTGRGRRGPTVK